MKRQRPEAKIQEAIFVWICRAAPDCVPFAIPNGGSRNLLEAINLKKMGVTSGVADLGIIAPNGITYYLEVKAPGGSQQPNQKMFERRANKSGEKYALAESIDDARAAFAKWGIPTRESVLKVAA